MSTGPCYLSGMPSEFRTVRRVELAETDLSGVVHFSNYFRFVEQAEHAFLRSIAPPPSAGPTRDIVGWPRVAASCEFLHPLRFDDEVEIFLSVERVGSRSIRYRFEMNRVAPAPAEPVARGRMTVVCARFKAGGGAFEPVRIPPEFAARIEPAAARPDPVPPSARVPPRDVRP